MLCVPLIEWIQIHFPKDTLTCRAWSSAWIIGVLHQIQYAVKQGCVRLRNALTCTSEAIFTCFVLCRGPGAGAEVTAGGVFSDLLRLAAYLGAPS